MSVPTLTITIDRTSLTLAPLVLSGKLDGTPLGIVNYSPPARLSRMTQMPDNPQIDGTEYTGTAWEKTMLGFDWMPDTATTETQVQASYAEVVAAVGQFEFTVKTKVSDAPEETWYANRGSVLPGDRTLIDLTHHNPVYAVDIPVHPIPGA